MSQVAHRARANPGFCSMKRLGIFQLPPGWDAHVLVYCRVPHPSPDVNWPVPILYTLVERGAVGVKCLA